MLDTACNFIIAHWVAFTVAPIAIAAPLWAVLHARTPRKKNFPEG